MTISPKRYSRALFIRFGGMGDILLATPSVRAVAAAFPSIAIDFVVGGGMTDALSGHPNVREILTFDKRGVDSRLDHFLPFLVKIARKRYDLVINLHPSAKSYLMAAASGAKTRLTFEKRMEVRADTGRVAHAVDDFAKELRPLGIESVPDRTLDFIVPNAAQSRVASLLTELGVSESDKLLVINPAASRPLNRWPLERFSEVAAFWAGQPGIKVALTGAPPAFKTVMDGLDEVSLAREVAAADSRILNLAGQVTVKEFGALLARADTLLTCDTGPMHIGAALGTPLVVLSGAADPDRTGPLTANSTVLIERGLECVPCRDRICRRGDMLCMSRLTTANVIAAIGERLGRTENRQRGIALPSPADKIKNAEELAEIVTRRQSAGEKIVLTNGVFDLLHVGHARYLAEARALGDALIIAVNSDESVRGFKDPLRPVVPLAERMELLAGLACVDYVVPFGTRTPVPLIEQVRPLVYAKGGDYTLSDLPEAAVVLGYGGSVQILSLVDGRSTTNLIARVCAAYCETSQE